jgi:hypothetical protein
MLDVRRGRRPHRVTGDALVRRRIIGLTVWVSMLTVGLFGVRLAVGVLQYARPNNGMISSGSPTRSRSAVSADVLRDEPVEELGWTGDAAVAVYDDAAAQIAGDGPHLGRLVVASALAGRHGSGSDDVGNLVVVVR